MVIGASIFGSHAAPHCLMASIATFLPFARACVSASIAVELRHHAFGQNRHNSSHAQFDGFLDNAFDDFSLRHGLQQRDGAGEAGTKFFSDTESVTALRRAIFDRAHKFISDAVQNGDEFATFQTQDVQRMMRLASVEPERGSGATSGGR